MMWSRYPVASRRASVQLRRFSSETPGGRGGGGGGRGREGRGLGLGGGRGRGRGGGGGGLSRFGRNGGRPAGTPHPGDGKKPHRGGPKKENFAKTVLEPASKGHLQKNYATGIPRLVARKPKSNNVHDQFPEKDVFQAIGTEGTGFNYGDGEFRNNNRRNYNNREDRSEHDEADREAARLATQRYFELLNNKPQYDSEDQYDEVKQDWDPKSDPRVSVNEEGITELLYDPDCDEDDDLYEYLPIEEGSNTELADTTNDNERNFSIDDDIDPEERFFFNDKFDFDVKRPQIPPEIANRVADLDLNYLPGLEGFLEGMHEHPTKYAQVKRLNPHDDSRRQAKPDRPLNRRNPEPEFVKAYMRFIYVSGLPPLFDENGELGDFDNPLQRQEVVKEVSQLFGVPTISISPASTTSAFIGFDNRDAFWKMYNNGLEKDLVLEKPVRLAADEENADMIVLSYIDPFMTAKKLSKTLFKANTNFGSIYGPLTEEAVDKKIGSTTARIKLKSTKLVEAALESSAFNEYLQKTLGQYRVQYFRAKRELFHSGFTGPNKFSPTYTKSDRLVVNGDAPSDNFLRDHAGVIHLRNVDEWVTKESLTQFFQPFSKDKRCLNSSIEFVKCAQGRRTDKVYIGFDRMGEAESVRDHFRGRLDLNGTAVRVRYVKEKNIIRSRTIREERLDRPVEELLASLQDWKRYVSPEDLMELEAKGINTDALGDMFRTLRYRNYSYGALDWSRRDERFEDMSEQGGNMKKAMSYAVEMLKQTHATPEDPGSLFKGMFMENEAIDFGIFAREEKRIEELRKRRNN